MYMGKNYTLYINVDKFAQEDNKSGLINSLLLDHYKTAPRVDKESVKQDLARKVDAMKVCKKGHLYKGAKCTQKGCNG